ncbi:hypothetical protein SELMODRAFT_89008 [Selaginella moellendorffii]|uniref:Uncharacterized protein mBAC2-1 n=1 Tax=Selaginella moellendorffii TaxID=88036 RepID=D8R8W7_SELML|nr:hypothetical protein SELMODRAFT_89008 [Selaginella moellendorffii]
MEAYDQKKSWGREFVAGGLGGMAGVISGHPLDTIRIRQQQPRHALSSVPSSATGMVRHLLRTEGVRALYKGMSSPLATVALQNAVAFQTYATLCRVQSPDQRNETLPLQRVAVAGFGTGALQTLILTPVELVKIKLQIQRSLKGCSKSANLHGPLQVARKITQTEGLRGLYRGLGITLIRDAPAHAVYFSSYEFLREKLHPSCRKNGGESILTLLTAGGFAGALSWIVCYPFDVIKTRLQSQGPGAEMRYTGIVDCLRTSVREEGRGVLWRGLGTALARAYLVNAAIFSAYEMSLRFLSASRAPDAKAFLKGAEEATLP